VVVVREGKRKTLDIKLGSLPGADTGSQVAGSQGPAMGGRVGVVVSDVDPRMRQSWQLDGGVMVESVDPDSPAAETGLRGGDVIVQLGFEKIEGVRDFER